MRIARERMEKQGVSNLEWVELGLREALHRDGCRVLESLFHGMEVPHDTLRTGEKRFGERCKTATTILGSIELVRSYYWNPETGMGRYPLDEALGLVDGYSPGMARLMCRAGAQNAYQEASEDLYWYGGIRVDGRAVGRMVNLIAPPMQAVLEAEKAPTSPQPPIPIFYVNADMTGVPMVREELEGRKGKQPDGSSKTREIKLGCVFTQTRLDEKGRPERDYQSTSYLVGFDDPDTFGIKLRREAFRRGMERAGKVVFISDGAPWLWDLQQDAFPFAVGILDFYHAAEHLTGLAEALWPHDPAKIQSRCKVWRDWLMEDGLKKIEKEAHENFPHHGERRENAQRELAYFDRNRKRMEYATFRAAGYFIGSGIVEAGCKTVIGKRAKQSGMFWSEQGVYNVLSVRAAIHGHRFDTYWNQRNKTPAPTMALQA